MKSIPRVPGGRPLLNIGYKYNDRKVLGFIADEGGGSTEPGDPYLSCFPDIYSNIYIFPVVRPNFLGSNSNSCSLIGNHNRMRQSDLSLEKYWLTQCVYFRLATTVAFSMGIRDWKLLYCHGVEERNVDSKISTLE